MRPIWMRGAPLLLALLMAASIALPARSAAAQGREFTTLSGPFSALCTLYDFTGSEVSNAHVWQTRYWFAGESKALLNGQRYTSLVSGHNHAVGQIDGPEHTYTGWLDWNLYAGDDPATATGWYEAQYVERTVGTGNAAHIEGHMAGQGYGDFEGQTIHGTLVVTEWWPSNDLCGGATPSALFNAILTLEVTGAP